MLNSGTALEWELVTRIRRRAWFLLLTTGSLPLLVSVGLILERIGRWLRYGRPMRSGLFSWEEGMPLELQLGLIFVMLLILLGVVLELLPSIRYQFLLPVPTVQLLRPRFWGGMLCCFGTMAIVLGCQNLVLDARLPVIGPSVYGAVSYAIVQAVLFVCRGDLTRQVFLGTFAGGAVLFAISRHYGTRPLVAAEHPWSEMTSSELVLLGVLVLICWHLSVRGAELQRCGEQRALFLGGFLERPIELTFSRTPSQILESETPKYVLPAASREAVGSMPRWAQFWFEWRRDGWLLPLGIGMFMMLAGLLGTGGQLYEAWSRRHQPILMSTYLAEFTWIGMALFVICSLLPVVTTSRGRMTLRQKGSQFTLTVPLSDRDLGWILFLQCLLAQIVAFGLILVIGLFWLGVQCLIAISTSQWDSFSARIAESINPSTIREAMRTGWIMFLIGWCFLGASVAAVLSGRRTVALLPLGSLVSLFCLGTVYSFFQVEPSQESVFAIWEMCVAMLVAWSFISAWIAGSLRPGDLLMALATWVFAVVSAFFVIDFPDLPLNAQTILVHAIPLLLLAVMLPFALLPWAVTVQRHQ